MFIIFVNNLLVGYYRCIYIINNLANYHGYKKLWETMGIMHVVGFNSGMDTHVRINS